MKLAILGLTLAALFVGGTQLEARSHFSLNIGPVFAPPPAYVVQPMPRYVQQRTYVDAWGYPAYTEAVVVQPAPVYYAPPRPAVSFGFGWMVR